MKVLLDTLIMLWVMTGDPRLSKIAREVIEDVRNELYFSVASLSEISLKHKIHEDQMPVSAREAREAFAANGYVELPFVSSHAGAMDDLPMLHRDPFDRMILAQAKGEGMKLLSHDNRFPAYGDFVIAV